MPADVLERLVRVIPLIKESAATVQELAGLAQFAIKQRPFALDEKTLSILSDETRSRLIRLTAKLAESPAWGVTDLAGLLKTFAESEGVGMGKFGPALRGVLSGGVPAPDLASALSSLGREESLGRLNDALCSAQ